MISPSSPTTGFVAASSLLLLLLSHLPSALAASGEPKYTGPLKYDPNTPANVIVGVVYTLLSGLFFFYVWRHRAWWALCLPIGAACSAIGFYIRLAMDPNNVTTAIYAIMMMFVVISPAAFLAFHYLLYGRWIAAVDPDFGTRTQHDDGFQEKRERKAAKRRGALLEKSEYSLMPPRLVGRFFIWSDITTFIVQAGAGGMQAAANDNYTMAQVGDKLFLAGVTLQGISYLFFTMLITVAMYRMRRLGARRGRLLPINHPIMVMIALFYFSSLCILIRSAYRIVEFAEGYNGYLISHEMYLMLLDSLPLILAIGTWAMCWPTRVLEGCVERVRGDLKSGEDATSQASEGEVAPKLLKL
ncbi:hypothetical protein ACQY0O_001119 [Thecaphora frezii]